MRRGLPAVLVLALTSLQTSAAQAAVNCGGGRAAVGDHCCWPGQTWNGDACAGFPDCPDGLVAEGHECERPNRGMKRPSSALPVGLVVGGLGGLALGYGLGLSMAGIALVSRGGNAGTCYDPGFFGAIPLVGPAITIGSYQPRLYISPASPSGQPQVIDCAPTVPYVFAATSEALQVGGLVASAVGVALLARSASQSTLRLGVGVATNPMGLTLQASWF